jgi:hypothetical protein
MFNSCFKWMDNFLSIYHGGNVEENPYGNAKFIECDTCPCYLLVDPP